MATTLEVTLSADEREAIARRVVELLAELRQEDGGWLDSAEAARHLGLSRTALDKLCASRLVPFEQSTPGGKRWFQRAELDRLAARGRMIV